MLDVLDEFEENAYFDDRNNPAKHLTDDNSKGRVDSETEELRSCIKDILKSEPSIINELKAAMLDATDSCSKVDTVLSKLSTSLGNAKGIPGKTVENIKIAMDLAGPTSVIDLADEEITPSSVTPLQLHPFFSRIERSVPKNTPQQPAPLGGLPRLSSSAVRGEAVANAIRDGLRLIGRGKTKLGKSLLHPSQRETY